jgi:hypothetical protein
MKPDPDPIRRLFRVARVSTAEVPTAESPYGFSNRLLARLKEALPESPCERLALLPRAGEFPSRASFHPNRCRAMQNTKVILCRFSQFAFGATSGIGISKTTQTSRAAQREEIPKLFEQIDADWFLILTEVELR